MTTPDDELRAGGGVSLAARAPARFFVPLLDFEPEPCFGRASTSSGAEDGEESSLACSVGSFFESSSFFTGGTLPRVLGCAPDPAGGR